MRGFLAISAIVHLVVLIAVAVPYQRQTAHGETMMVELVSPSEAPPFNEEPAPAPPDEQQPQQSQQQKPSEPLPDFSKLRLDPVPKPSEDQKQQPVLPPPPQQQAQKQQQQTQQQQQPAPQQQQAAKPQPAPQPVPSPPPVPAAQPAEPPQAEQPLPEEPKIAPEMAVETLADQGNRLAALMNLPPVNTEGFGSEAETKAKLETDDIGKFKAHLKTCWKLPAGVSENQQIKVILRIALRPDGSLAAQPSLIEAAASELGLPIYRNAVAALKQCAPYSMLPREKYKEWRVLDINFSPDLMARG